MTANLNQLQSAMDYRFADINLLRQALTHRSVGKPNNERLEFLGDALLDYIVGELLFNAFPEASEGDLTQMRAGIVNKTALASLARKLSLGDYLNLSTGEAGNGGRTRDSILADSFEALLAAVYLDSNIQQCKTLVTRFTKSFITNHRQRQRKDFKTRLQEIVQARGIELPIYSVIETHGQAHAQEFVVECKVHLLDNAEQGKGSSKRAAEQAAARAVLERLGELNSDE